MIKQSMGAVAFVFLAASVGVAADAPPSVSSMTCEQMSAELTVAGQTMAKQLDPEFAKEAQAMAEEARGAGSAGTTGSAVATAATCAIPGLGMLCMVGQQAQMAGASEKSEENLGRMQAQMDRLQKAMEGLDQERLMALTQRFEEMKCQVPQ